MPQLSRRTLLKGVGASLALPIMDAMVPNVAWAAPEQLAQNRMAFVFFPNGAIMRDWTPKEEGTDYELPKTLQPLKSHKKDLLVMSGLAHVKARANGDGGGDHARCTATYLTGVQAKKTDGADIRLGQSIDQLAADQIGNQTKLPSLELGTEAGRQAGKCDSGYSCAYTSNISWKSEKTPMAKEINPKETFERLFGNATEDSKARAKRDFFRQSILDFVAEDSSKLKTKLGTNDRQKLDEYFTSVREIEQRIERTADASKRSIPPMERPAGVPKDWAEHVRLMYDLMVVAFQTDTTRISTFMLANAGSNRSYKEIGVAEGHHQLSHHRNEDEPMNKIQKIDEYSAQQFAYFLDRLASIKEGDRTLLDNSMVIYGSALSDANRHQHDDLPIVLAGGGAGTITGGRHVRYTEETPMTNLYLSMLDRMNVKAEHFGDSTGRIDNLKV